MTNFVSHFEKLEIAKGVVSKVSTLMSMSEREEIPYILLQKTMLKDKSLSFFYLIDSSIIFTGFSSAPSHCGILRKSIQL